MQISGLGYYSYIYNTNYLNRNSMNAVSGIGDDVESKKTNFSGLSSVGENTNPLKIGQTKDFISILAAQMEMSRMNRSRVLGAEDAEIAEDFLKVSRIKGLEAGSIEQMNPLDDVTPEDGVDEITDEMFDMLLQG